jgi:hypothetical protein
MTKIISMLSDPNSAIYKNFSVKVIHGIMYNIMHRAINQVLVQRGSALWNFIFSHCNTYISSMIHENSVKFVLRMKTIELYYQ